MRLTFLCSGFTLIELMVAMTILSIISAFAIPSYQHYLQRARFSEAISIANTYKNIIAIALQEGTPASELNNGQHDIPLDYHSDNIAEITVKKSIINIVASKKIQQITYVLTPDNDGSHWNVSGTCLQQSLCRP